MTQPAKAKSKLADSNGLPQIGDQQSAITAGVVAHSITDVAADLSAANEAEIEGFLDALGTAINSIISVLEAHGLTADN
jgi:hypothetical protein